MSSLSLAFAGGGTGGHVVPGRHLLAHLRASGADLGTLLWFGAGRPIEDRALAGIEPELGGARLERVALSLEPPGGGAPGLGRLALRTGPEVRRARRALQAAGSRVLVGLGGYTTLPAVLAARSLGLPVVLLEINAAAGRATRVLARLSTRVVHAWKSTLPARGGERHLHLGPPLGPEFLAPGPDEAARAAGRRALGFDPVRPLLLVLGGSQGALGLNRFLREHAAGLVAGGLSVWHQVGPGRRDEAPAPAAHLRVDEYVPRVAEALGLASLVLCRGGASTLAEVAAVGRAALCVPYPHHADRHQARNAAALGEAVRVIPEETLSAATVEELVRLAHDAPRRHELGERLRTALPRDGGPRLAELVLELAGAIPAPLS